MVVYEEDQDTPEHESDAAAPPRLLIQLLIPVGSEHVNEPELAETVMAGAIVSTMYTVREAELEPA